MSDYIYNGDENRDNTHENTESTSTGGAPVSDHVENTIRYTPSFSVQTAPKKSKKRTVSAGAVAVICIVCILLSCGAGFAGAYLFMGTNSSLVGVGQAGTESTPINVHRSIAEETSTYDPSIQLPLPSVVTKVRDTVVEITTEFKNVSPFYQYVTSGAGSGVIISNDGYIITNNHVISDNDSSNKVADSIVVRLRSGEEFPGEVIGRDKESDIAIIKIAAEGLTAAELGDSDGIVVGEEVVAIGNPLGSLGGSVTNGIISALDREINVDGNVMNLLQTNADVNPGNSGGGLFNMQGKLIGVVNAKSSGNSIEGIGFAIPINDAYSVVQQLLEYGYVRGKPQIGVRFKEFTDRAAAYYYFGSSTPGVFVIELVESYNEGAIQVGDRVIIFDGVEVTEIADIATAMSKHKVGDEIKMTVVRKGKTEEITVKCYEKRPEGISFAD